MKLQKKIFQMSLLVMTGFGLMSNGYSHGLEVGTLAPDFILKTKTPEGLVDKRLSDNFGKKNTVLLFFPAVFTPVCKQSLCEIRDKRQSEELAGTFANAEVYGISTDNPFAQENWAEQEGINVTLLSDYRREVVELYNVEWPDFFGLGPSSARAVFVIDKKGVVRHCERTVEINGYPNFPAAEEVLNQLNSEG